MKLSIIIVNYNTFNLTCECVASIQRHVPRDGTEVVVIDNASSSFDETTFRQKFPNVQLILLDDNVGFGPANNIGMKHAAGEYFLLLNSDTIIFDDGIQRCVAFLDSPEAIKQNIGVLGCKLLNPDRSYQHSSFPYLKNNLWTYFTLVNPVALKIRRIFKQDRHQLFNRDQTQFVGDISGAFMLLRRDVATRSGYFDTDFFMYAEDTEWCRERLSRISRIIYYPHASIIHLGGQSAPQEKMYVQSKLSLSLLWYKKGTLNYAGYLLVTFITILTMVIILPVCSKESSRQIRQFISAYRKIFFQLFTDVPRYGREPNSRRTKLIYEERPSSI